MNKRTGMEAWEAFDVIAIDDYDGACCDVCGGELEWEDCPDCRGAGFYEHMGDAEEPWDSLETCDTCGGDGGWWYCPHPHEGGYAI